MITKEFRDALKLHPTPKHRLAWSVGISPSTLSHLINGHQKVVSGDPRLIRVAHLIGFPEGKIFEEKAA